MKKITIILSVLLVLAALMTACNIPFLPSAPQVVEGTPNATLTALFDPNHGVPATITPPVIATVDQQLPTVALETATQAPTMTETAQPTATFTAAPTATNTTAPTAAPAFRPNAQRLAYYLSTPPVQDGTYAEWVEKTQKYTMQYVVWGKANWVDYADAEGVYAIAWDNTNLYIGVKMTDDVYNQPYTGDQIYIGDAIEVLIDTDLLGDFYTTSYSLDDYHLGISAGNPSTGVPTQAYLWNPSSVKGLRTQVGVSYLFESATIKRIEAVIPWSMLGITPYNGMRLGFAICLDDNDNVTDYDKVSMLSSASGLAVFNPTTWGELVLTK